MRTKRWIALLSLALLISLVLPPAPTEAVAGGCYQCVYHEFPSPWQPWVTEGFSVYICLILNGSGASLCLEYTDGSGCALIGAGSCTDEPPAV